MFCRGYFTPRLSHIYKYSFSPPPQFILTTPPPQEVQKHNSADSLWIIIDGHVYDLTQFQNKHPGGKPILNKVAGTDASEFFHKYHNVKKVMKKFGIKFRIGKLVDSPLSTNKSANSTTDMSLIKPNKTAADFTGATAYNTTEAAEPFGDMVPFADPNWYQGYRSPYYKASHAKFREEVRDFVEEHLEPYVDDWEEDGVIPAEVYKKFGEAGFIAAGCGIPVFPAQYTDRRLKSVTPEEFDPFHELVLVDELSRTGSGGLVWFLVGGLGIGLPPIWNFASEEIKRRVLPGIFAGDKRVCLCITEPDAGSDVANIRTTAQKTPDGKHFIVNGTKKWITNGVWADYFTVAVRTGGPGMGGISVLLLEKTMPGITVRKLTTQGMLTSGSTYITFEDVKVPVEHLLGKENQGFKVIVHNFNHERLGIIGQANRFSRVCYEEAVKHAHKRKTFGTELINHAVIRNKLANMAIRIEAVQTWYESLTYQMALMPAKESALRLGGAIAGCKALATQTFELCAREASQVYGGLAYTRGGQAGKVERLYREVRAYAIPGGSEEIMLDLTMRQSLKVHQFLGAKL